MKKKALKRRCCFYFKVARVTKDEQRKLHKSRSFWGIVLSVLLISLPVLAQSNVGLGQQEKTQTDIEQEQAAKAATDAEKGRLDGTRDGRKHKMNSIFWGAFAACAGTVLPIYIWAKMNNGYGCALGVFAGLSVGFLSFISMVPPAPAAFAGKSPEYVSSYIEAFRHSLKKSQIKVYCTAYAITIVFWAVIAVLVAKRVEDHPL